MKERNHGGKPHEQDSTSTKLAGENGGNCEVQMDSDQNCDVIPTDLIRRFKKKIKLGPEHVCTCCNQLWYRTSVIKCNKDLHKVCPESIIDSCITGVKSVDNTEMDLFHMPFKFTRGENAILCKGK